VSLPAPAAGARAVVTGASSGIGRELARGLAARGHALLLVARRAGRLAQLAADLRARHGVDVDVRQCDLGDRADRGRLRDELASLEVSVLCSNAGFATCGSLLDADPEREAEELEVNGAAMQELTLAVLPGMLARRSGAILITGSNAGEQPIPTAATYAASKAFANTFAEALHHELKGSGVTCTLLAPGPVRTEWSQVAGVANIEGHRWIVWMTPERVARDALRGLERGRRIVIPGAMAKAQALAGRYTPRGLMFPILGRIVLPLMRRSTGGRPRPRAGGGPAGDASPDGKPLAERLRAP
jgi:short-subunit dehydrogenase